MNVADLRLLFARLQLTIAGKGSLRTMQEDRAAGKALADALIEKLALSAQEAAILRQVADTEVIYANPPAGCRQERSGGIDMLPIGTEKDERKPRAQGHFHTRVAMA
jgi:hypothetical protein